MKMTMREIAELAGVSVTTVSQILNNKGSRFSDETRKRVLKVVQEQQYQPDFFAANIIKRQSKMIGMIVPDVSDFFFSKIIEGAQSYLTPLGYMLLLNSSRHSQENELAIFNEFLHRSVDGILFATPNVLPNAYKMPQGFYQQTPVILIDRGINQRDMGRLIVKEYESAYQAVRYFIQQGHRHIGMLKEQTGYYQLEERYNGYRNALKDFKLPYKRQYVETQELTVSGGYQAAKKLLRQKEITAIFCGNDAMAIGCYQAIYEQGLRVPEDISVIGFDALYLSEYMTPPLTTIMQPAFDIGYTAAKFLIAAIDQPDEQIPNKIFDTKLIIRESVKSLTTAE